MRINNGLANTPLLTGLGFSNTMSGAVPLPLDLTSIGAPTCFLRVDPAITNFAFTDAGGFYFWDLPIPLDNVRRMAHDRLCRASRKASGDPCV